MARFSCGISVERLEPLVVRLMRYRSVGLLMVADPDLCSVGQQWAAVGRPVTLTEHKTGAHQVKRLLIMTLLWPSPLPLLNELKYVGTQLCDIRGREL